MPAIDTVALGIAAGEQSVTCDLDDALELIMDDDDKAAADAPSAVNKDVAANLPSALSASARVLITQAVSFIFSSTHPLCII